MTSLATPGQPFDYSALNAETANQLRHAVGRIRERHQGMVEGAIEIGETLIEIKSRLDHGQFGPWLAAEFGWTDRTARNYMLAAEAFASKRKCVSGLPVATVYQLAAPSTPQPVRDEIVLRLEAGDKVPAEVIKFMIAEGRKARENEKKKPSLGETREGNNRDDCEQIVALHVARWQAVEAATDELVVLLRRTFGKDLAQLVDVLDRAHMYELIALLQPDVENIAEAMADKIMDDIGFTYVATRYPEQDVEIPFFLRRYIKELSDADAA